MAKEFLKGLLPLMILNFFVILGVLGELKDGGGLLATLYISFLFPVLIAPIALIYFILDKKHPIRAWGVMTSVIITFLLVIMVFILHS